ncbi:pyridoxal phosphate-dependent aminotransferase family protein [Priestia aryabhattai]|uniref:aminotransferase class I/II-fold pyridoxal phosphate-dependent enzyme n=1 Tax=Priestia aryabhattai TaxID=412384 RepID=UPI002882C90F|nr:pyridoxal phosphate-dependent aminotransferase family protein [Priestia aryabhattai]MDT0150166.1 pyridoxal phosphate-dependent aminotransferase family protein [Priestia aryabhattai]MDT0155764.1 pyridoxal phosphate-dependent aminotransferase family protein [Priestia aryabhattai]
MVKTIDSRHELDKFGQWKEEGRYPYLPTITKTNDNYVTTLENGKMLMFGSCDYLGLSQNAYIKNKSIEAIQNFGTNTYGAQIFCGHTTIHKELENKLAFLFDKPSAVIFPSGMAANIGVLSVLATSEDVIINDRFNHISIFMGAELSGAQLRSYPHNNLKKLESILQQSLDKQKRIIVVDGLFSADGDYAPLDEICKLAKMYNAMLVVDEAHSFGVVGPKGLGVAEHFNLIDEVDVIVGTMSKAVGSVGGFVVTNSEIVQKIRHYAPSYTSSRGSVPAVAAASLASLEYMEKEGRKLREKLWINTQYVIDQLHTHGFSTMNTCSPIIPILIGDDDKTVNVANWLMKQGLFTATMVSPAVPSNKGRLRIGITSTHSIEECKQVINLLQKARDIYEF